MIFHCKDPIIQQPGFEWSYGVPRRRVITENYFPVEKSFLFLGDILIFGGGTLR